MSIGQMLTGNTVKAATSGAALVATDVYVKGVTVPSTIELQRFAVQFGASALQNSVLSFVRPILPDKVVQSPKFLVPVVVGGTFTLIQMFLSPEFGMKYWQYNMIASTLSEGASSLIAPQIASLLGQNSNVQAAAGI